MIIYMKKIVWIQFVVLLGGTIFAWTNFGLEMKNYLAKVACTSGCAIGVNPFYTPCFWGAVFFAIAFILNILIIRYKPNNEK